MTPGGRRGRLRILAAICGAVVTLGLVAGCAGSGSGLSHGVVSPPAGASNAGSADAPADADRVATQLHEATQAVVWPQRAVPADAVQHPVVVDGQRQATRTIDADGGEISTTGADGAQLRLVVPPGALFFPTAITISPVTEIAGLSADLVGVDIQPHGLQLAEIARVEITGADLDGVIGFSYSGTGVGVELAVIDPDPDRLVVYVEHFSGVGVGPFEALSQALAGATDPGRAELADATASAHNGRGGVDRIADAYTDLVNAVGALADTTPGACGAQAFSGRLAVLAWVNFQAEWATAFDLDITNLDVIHLLTEKLLTCWTDSARSCVHPSPDQLRALQGIRAALIRYKALDDARERSGKDSLNEIGPCAAGGFVSYHYDDTEGGVSTQISVTLDLVLAKDPDGRGLVASDQSSYTMAYASVKGGECPSSEYGQTSLVVADTSTGSEVAPELQVAFDDEIPSIWFAPVYFGHWADCHDAGAGWQALALACNPYDPSGGDSLAGEWGIRGKTVYFDCTSQDHKATAVGAVFLTGALDWLIPAELWE